MHINSNWEKLYMKEEPSRLRYLIKVKGSHTQYIVLKISNSERWSINLHRIKNVYKTYVSIFVVSIVLMLKFSFSSLFLPLIKIISLLKHEFVLLIHPDTYFKRTIDSRIFQTQNKAHDVFILFQRLFFLFS